MQAAILVYGHLRGIKRKLLQNFVDGLEQEIFRFLHFLNSDSKTCILAWFALHDTYFSTVLEGYLIHGLKMFWKFDLHPSSAIDTMLTREVSLIFVCIRFAISSRKFFLFCVTFYYLLKSFFSRIVLWAKYWTKMMCCKRQNRRIESWSTCK